MRRYTEKEKIERLLELVPDLPEANAKVLLGLATGEAWVFTRGSIINKAEELAKDVISGRAFSPLYRLL